MVVRRHLARKKLSLVEIRTVRRLVLFGCVCSSVALVYIYFSLLWKALTHHHEQQLPLIAPPDRSDRLRPVVTTSHNTNVRTLSMELARLPPERLLEKLEEEDPFQVRQFDEKLKAAEAERGRRLTLHEFGALWQPCPTQKKQRSEARDLTKAERFRAGHGFLFFQHLRKAGGTMFCTLASANMLPKHLPRYYCMPDYDWPSKQKPRCAGCLHHYDNSFIESHMGHYRIAGNEWDPFRQDFLELEAVFVTSFRKPLDRALSQFRFECVEGRGCKIKDVGVWWKKRRDLYNVYTWTFSDMPQMARITDSTKQAEVEKRAQAIGKALDVLSQFHLVLVTEWLSYAEQPIRSMLGFTKTEFLNRPIRPHNQRNRTDSWTPKEYLTVEQYKEFSKYLALDELLTDAVRRMFLERIVCDHQV